MAVKKNIPMLSNAFKIVERCTEAEKIMKFA
jgi:hypothetical protein